MTMTLLEKWKAIAEMASDPDISRGELAAAVVLLDSMSANGVAQLGHSAIAKDAGQTTRSAKRATDGLIEKRYFEQVGHGGPGCPNRYRRPEDVRMVVDGRAGAFGCPSGCRKVGTSTSPPLVGTATSPHKNEVGTPTSPYGDTLVPTVGTPASDIPSYPLLPKKKKATTVDVASNVDADFEELRLTWPTDRRDGLAGALGEYTKARTGATHAALMEAGRAYVASRDPQFCVGLRRWLREGRYTEPVMVASGGVPSSSGESYAQRQLQKLAAEAAQ
jgi:hypothetical protein